MLILCSCKYRLDVDNSGGKHLLVRRRVKRELEEVESSLLLIWASYVKLSCADTEE